jgi:predicted phosphoribosyltransferase
MLASQIAPKYQDEKCAVVALNDGGVMVGAQIALKLHCSLTLLESETIELPREPEAIAGMAEDGSVSYNSAYSSGEIDELVGEYYQLIEQEKLTKLHEMNRLVGSTGLISRDLLTGHNVVLVADGLKSGFMLDVAVQFLKPIAIRQLVVATPLSSVKAVDHMHVLADAIFCLNVVEDYISTGHYYNQQDVPDHKTAIKTVQQIIVQQKSLPQLAS